MAGDVVGLIAARLRGLWNSMQSIMGLAKHHGFRAVKTKPGGELLFVAAGGEGALTGRLAAAPVVGPCV